MLIFIIWKLLQSSESLMKSCVLCSIEESLTEEASSNSSSSAHMSGRTFISAVSFTLHPCSALTYRLHLAECQRRPSERLEFIQSGCGCLHCGCRSGAFQHTDAFGFPWCRCVLDLSQFTRQRDAISASVQRGTESSSGSLVTSCTHKPGCWCH